MRQRVPDDFLALLRQKTDIVDVVSEHVRLTRSGQSHVGRCPFHAEKTPSFTVSRAKGLYHCFGCGAGGTAVTFLMDLEQISFLEAVEQLAQKAGLSVPYVQDAESGTEEGRRRNELFRANELAAKFYNHILMNHAAGAQALTYLLDRGLSKKTAVQFQLGYAPRGGRALADFLRERSFSDDQLVEAGLVYRTDRGEVRDRFRERVIFPIRDTQTRVLGFGARTLSGAEPKYLNTGETPLFRKGRQLFGYHTARRAIRQSGQAILLEGYMDVIALHQAGFANAVGGLGTALSEEQAGLLQRVAEEVVIVYDGDAAGQKAARSAVELFRGTGVSVKVSRLPTGVDPDDWIRTRGPDAFRVEVLGGALPGLQFLLTDLMREHPDYLGSARVDYVRKALAVIASEGSSVEREAGLAWLGETCAMPLGALREDLERVLKHKKEKEIEDRNRNSWNTVTRASGSESGRRDPVRLPPPSHETAARQLLTSMLLDARVAKQVQDRLDMEFPLPLHSALQAYLYAFYAERETADPELFLSRVDDPDVVRFAAELLREPPGESGRGAVASEGEIEDYIQCIIDFWLDRELDRVSAHLKDAGQRGDMEGMRNLNLEFQSLLTRRRRKTAGS